VSCKFKFISPGNTAHQMKPFSDLILFVVLVFFGSCVTSKSLTSGKHQGGSVEHPVTDDVNMDLLQMTQVPYTWFAGSGQGKIDWDGERYSVRFNVRIRHDSLIWMQISKFGFEVGRMLVTPDSAFFINRLDHTYSKYKTLDFLRAYNVPADFEMFSRVFTAGAYIPSDTKEVEKEQDGSIVVSGGSGVTAQHWLDAEVLYRSFITDVKDHAWTAGFSDYEVIQSGQVFPFKRSNMVLIDGQSNVFDLEYSNVILDVPQDFPFSIPSHYEKQ